MDFLYAYSRSLSTLETRGITRGTAVALPQSGGPLVEDIVWRVINYFVSSDKNEDARASNFRRIRGIWKPPDLNLPS